MTTMYQALYRKYRPMTFDEVVGQDHITTTLRRQVETGRLSHAYLFIGTRGTGKTTCARILARAVNCEHPVNGSPCNQCAACRGILDGSVMDVVELDAASNNKVDDVRSLREEAVFSPASVKKRVYIIDEAHALASSSMAFNALLKILEEPPEHVIFILCTTDPQKLPPTIVSRCQRHNFTRIEPDDIAARLLYVAQQEQIGLTADAAALLARMADGGMRDALSLMDQCSASENIDTAAVLSSMGLAGSRRTAELLDAIRTGSTEKALTLFDGLWRDGKDPAGILNELGGLMRDVLILQVAPRSGETLISGIYDLKTLQYFAAKLSGSQLMDSMNAIRAAALSGSDPRRAAEMCLVSLCVPETGESLAGLRNRLSKLEAAVQAGAVLSPAAAPAPAAYAPLPKAAPAPEPQPQPKPASPPEAEILDVPAGDMPWYTDDDAPPEDGELWLPPIPEAEPAPAPKAAPTPKATAVPKAAPAPTAATPKAAPAPKATPAPAAAPATETAEPAAGDTAIWDAMVKRLAGRIDLSVYAMLTSTVQVSGVLTGDTLTVHLDSPIAKLMVDTPTNAALFRQELMDMTGRDITVRFASGKPAAGAKPDTSKLDALSRFSNVRFE